MGSGVFPLSVDLKRYSIKTLGQGQDICCKVMLLEVLKYLEGREDLKDQASARWCGHVVNRWCSHLQIFDGYLTVLCMNSDCFFEDYSSKSSPECNFL